MKRLLRVSFDIFITSFTSIISWLLLGIIFGQKITNIYTITYPLQCLIGIILSVFGIGANVSSYKDNNENYKDSGIFYGTVFSSIIFIILAINCEKYLNFMNMNYSLYKNLCIYSIFQMLFQLIMQLVVTKLQYKEENKKANIITFLFNIINFISIILSSLITKNQIISSIITLIILGIFDIIIILKYIEKIEFRINILKWFKYDSVSCCISILFFIIYLFGFSNTFSFGKKYILAITFSTLVTDLQWDIITSIKTVAKIDIVKNKFNYNYHFKNAMKLDCILIFSILILIFTLYPIYKPDIYLISIYLSLHIYDFLITPFKNIKICYLEIEDSAFKMTSNTILAYIIRMVISFLPTPYCTIIGQVCSSTYELIYSNIKYLKYKNKNYTVKC